MVRGLFERNVDAVFRETHWETTTKANDFILFVCILFECGEDLETLLCCNHEVTYHESRRGVSLFAWKDKLGCIAQDRLLVADPSFIYPIPSLILAYLEILSISELPGSTAAEAMLCAVKTPEKVCPLRPSKHAPPRLLTLQCLLQQMSVRESLYRLVNVDVAVEKIVRSTVSSLMRTRSCRTNSTSAVFDDPTSAATVNAVKADRELSRIQFKSHACCAP